MTIHRFHHNEAVPPHFACHAAMPTIPCDWLPKVILHDHDFYEWTVVMDGTAVHMINGTKSEFSAGQLYLVRPLDQHSLHTTRGRTCTWVNIAFSVQMWNDFVRLNGMEELAKDWESRPFPISIDMPPKTRQVMEQEALTLMRMHDNPTRLGFSRFWNAAVDAVMESQAQSHSSAAMPIWLRDLVIASRAVPVAELSVQFLSQASGVSYAHLCRSMKSYMNVSPTEYINRTRLSHAAYEIVTTGRDITSIALDCGYENLSYFYRRFHQAYTKSPKQYRTESMRPLHG